MVRRTWFYIIVLFRNCLPVVTGFSILENEIVINHLEPTAVESNILHFDSEYDDRWFSVGICKYKPGYKSHDLL